VILEHSVLGLHTCLVPVFLPSSLLLCITCPVPALQYTPLHLLSTFIHLVCILFTLILASLHCTCFVIARQISPFVVDIQGKPHHCPRRTLWPTNRNINGQTACKQYGNSLLPTILNQVEIALDIRHGSNIVFGDLCHQNIIITKNNHAMLINFDWSREHGKARYPVSMNGDINWHPDAGQGLLMKEPDVFLLQSL
jgi:hypothetical protein